MEVSVQEKEIGMDETCEKSEFSSQSIKQIESDVSGNHKYVKQVSTSPPVVLIQTDTGEESDKLAEASWPLIATEKQPQPQQQPQQQQPFVLLQSDDMNEMNLVLRLIREKFPNVRINLYEQDEQCMDTHASEASKQHKSEPSRNKINKITTINRNSLSATYNLNDRTRLSQSTSRSNLDNMERQESRDSGFWSVSKCSFESMKSLSISDSPHAGQKADASGNNHAANSPTMGNQPNVVERTSNAPTPTPVNPTSDNDTTKSDLAENDLSNDMSSNTSVNEAAPSTAKSPLNDWKKWKKKQAWRYNSSSSNLSQYDAPNESSSNNNLSSGPIYGSNSFDGTSLCSYGTARSTGRENQLTPELAYQQQLQTPGGQQHQVPSLGQMHNYSNSFESALRCTPTPPGVSNNLLTANAHHHSSATVQTQLSHLNPWASTSKLDLMKNEMATSSSASSAAGFDDQAHQFSKGQKRRGKLVRDRTIDNPDEHQTLSLSNLNNSSGSVNASGVKTNESAAKIATSNSPDIAKSFEDQSKESTRQQVNNVNTQMASMNGRISPPEKRVSLHLKSDIDEMSMSCRGKLSLDEIDKSQRVIIKRNSFKSQDSSLSISPPPPTQLTKASSLKTTTNNTPSPTTSSGALNNTTTSNSSSLSSSPSPSSLQEVMNSMAMTAAAFAAAVASSASATPTSSSIDNLPNQYDFYKELQAKLSIKTNEPEEPNNLFTSMYSLSLSKNNHNNNTQKPSKNSNQNLASDHTNNNNNYHHSSSSIDTMTNTSSSDQHYNRINVMRSLGANFNLSTGNSSTGNYLSQSSNKSMCRSNSSPSYSIQPTPGNPNSTGPYYPPNLMSSYINYPPYSLGSSTYQLNQNHNLQQSTPIQQLPFNYNMNKPGPPLSNSYFYNTFSSKLPTTVPTINRLSPYFYDVNPDVNNNNKSAGTTSSPRQSFLNNKPPEIVITESKSENEPNDYGPSSDGAKIGGHLIDQNNYVNCFKLSPGVEATGAFGASAGGGSKLTTPGMMLFDGKNRSGPSRGSESSLESGHRLFDEWRANFSSLVKSESQTSLSNKVEQQQSAAKSPSSKLTKPHICTSCQKRFARSDMLIRHSRLHSGVRPYRCNRCGQEFSRSDHLNTHLRTHTGEKPYSCPHPKCTYAACRKDMITRHMKVHNKTRISLSFDADNNKSLEAINKMMTLPSISFDTSSINSLSPAHTPVPHPNNNNNSTSFSNDDHLLSSAQSNKS